VVCLLVFSGPVGGFSAQISAPPPTVLGQAVSFTITVNIQEQELLPIQSVDLEISGPPGAATIACPDLPLAAQTKNYTTIGGLIRIQAIPAANWGYGYGYGYGVWQGQPYSWGYGYGYGGYGYGYGPGAYEYGYGYGMAPTSIAYNVTWYTPSAWPAGTYVAKVMITANGVTFVQTRSFSLLPRPEEARFVVSDLVIAPKTVLPGEVVTIAAKVSNVGDLSGTYTLTLKIDGVVEATKDVTLVGGGFITVTFAVIKDVPGTYAVEVDGLTGTFEVLLIMPPEVVEIEAPPVEIPTITPEVPESIVIEETSITEITIAVVEEVADVTVTVQQLVEPPPEVVAPPVITYRYLNIVGTNITDEDIEVATIDFKVARSWIEETGVDVDTITLSRYDPVTQAWEWLPTTKIGEDETYVYFSAESPGLSVFAIGVARPAEFVMSDLRIAPVEVDPGETVFITAQAANVGEATGTYTVTLKINGVVEATEEVTLGGGKTAIITFTTIKEIPATYLVEVDGLEASFKVLKPPLPPWIEKLPSTGEPILDAFILALLAAAGLLSLGAGVWLIRRRARL